MKKIYFLCSLAMLSLVNCGSLPGASEKKSYFEKTPDEINTTTALKDFLAKNKSPKVVLRVNNSTNKLTENENVEVLYAIIEKELMANGFEVRDRQLFNQIVENKENTSDYTNLNKRTDTDLIIELMEMNTKVPYSTNIYIDGKTGDTKTSMFPYNNFGRNIEFKVIIIKTNQFAGSYKFNYTPCVDGCIIQQATPSFQEMKEMRKKQASETRTPEGFSVMYSKKENEDFVRLYTQKLIQSMRSN